MPGPIDFRQYPQIVLDAAQITTLPDVWPHEEKPIEGSRVLAATYKGWGRERAMHELERKGVVPSGTADAVRAGATWKQISRAMLEVEHLVDSGALDAPSAVAEAASGAREVVAAGGGEGTLPEELRSNPVSGGLYFQKLARDNGWLVPDTTVLEEAVGPELETAITDADLEQGAASIVDDVKQVASDVGDVVFGRKSPTWREGLRFPEDAIHDALRMGVQVASHVR
jgi:hypothetical protein